MFIYTVYLREGSKAVEFEATSYGKVTPKEMANDGGLSNGGYERERDSYLAQVYQFFNGEELVAFFRVDDVSGLKMMPIPQGSIMPIAEPAYA